MINNYLSTSGLLVHHPVYAIKIMKGVYATRKIGISPSPSGIVRTVEPQATYPAGVIILRKERVIVNACYAFYTIIR